MNETVFLLRGQVRHYAWGGKSYLPDLLGREPGDQPWAEYWLGAHPGDPAEILVNGQWRNLAKLISEAPAHWLGAVTAERFNDLPYLMKVLDVASPLSIQVHPNAAQASAGFAQENQLGIAADSPLRNFKDANPKPELALALSRFWLLSGFRPLDDGLAQLRRFPSLAGLAELLEGQGLRVLFETLMRAPAGQLARWLLPVFELAANQPSEDPSEPVHWIGRWAQLHSSPGEAVDRGIFGFLLMKLVGLEPGETIFQDANVPHAYLHGQCAEIMANSDNVLRGGLTPKHVDVEALINHINFAPAGKRQSQPPPSLMEFSLTRLQGEGAGRIVGPACGLVLAGRVDLGSFSAERGAGFFVRGGQQLDSLSGDSVDVLAGSPAPALVDP